MERNDRSLLTVVGILRCHACKGPPAPASLCADSAQSFMRGPPPAWAVEPGPGPELNDYPSPHPVDDAFLASSAIEGWPHGHSAETKRTAFLLWFLTC